MSKAFVNEDAETADDAFDDSDDDESESAPSVPKGAKNYITLKGQARLKAELHDLLTNERPKLVETVAWAASNGDRSENADYIYGKRRLREIDRRIRFLTKRLDACEIVDPSLQKSEVILFGATVVISDEDRSEEHTS